ncbi:glycogen debranching protein GlgX [Novosphingobium sp. KN65.2]|uniref:glycogen debranching protein GlgX n=1 Tax=Novosphingobium sp. KN65.2 TaxID=1478134 RepID=UPI0005DE597D|nr:glycogen debranching protein GlgX [Novosphingobium sp. KN65.2]CDO34286.1 Glycogen debranching enzyme [Novosphingobium sp. KN65.2]
MTRLGATVQDGTTRFAVRSPKAERVWLCLFNGRKETRHEMARDGDVWTLELPGDLTGTRYGYRAAGEWAPERGRWFDSAKLLVDPYAVELDRRFRQDRRLSAFGKDTAAIVPKARVPAPLPPVAVRPPHFAAGGLIYEVNVRAFTMCHPEVPRRLRGTVAALAHPAVLAHLKKLHVMAVELMPVVAWIDERHLPPLGLVNAWGYNPVAMMALDPGLCPGGITELRETVAALHAEGIGVLLDLVFNHTGESDVEGGVISLRGLDDAVYGRAPDGSLINDSGCGNTLDFANPAVRRLALDAMRHFVSRCGVDGFRFDLAPILARGPGFDPAAPIFTEIDDDPLLSNRVLIAEPWDIGPGGYQLANFPAHWLEWNDRFRDDVRRFWREEEGVGKLATRLAGSSDIFGPHWPHSDCRSVNFLAAHDGFTLADTVSYAHRHNEANGEQNRDGHGENFSWNNGAEGPTDDPHVLARRAHDLRALLGTLFASTGTIMLTAGDEFGHSQQGNNNAYCQDNEIGWIDWESRDLGLEDHVARLSLVRAKRRAWFARFPDTVEWHRLDGVPKTVTDWENPHSAGFVYEAREEDGGIRVEVRRHDREVRLTAI